MTTQLDWTLFVSVFSLIFVAELPDKTAFAILLMATKGKPYALFTGVATAFLIQCIVAVAFGRFISLLPHYLVHWGAGAMFIGFSLYLYFSKDEEEEDEQGKGSAEHAGHPFFKSAWKAFIIIFIAEWGDLTQLATASLVARDPKNTLTIFIASVLALWCTTALAILLGNKLKDFIKPKILKMISVVVFMGIGIYFLVSSF